MLKEEFIESIQEGKWFRVYNQYQTVYAVKMKEVLMGGRKVIQSLWLSFRDPEAMCFAEYVPTDWYWKDGVFMHQSSGVFHFGSPMDSREGADDCIYDEKSGEIIESRMKQQIFEYASEGFITEKEFEDVWSKLKGDITLDFDILRYDE